MASEEPVDDKRAGRQDLIRGLIHGIEQRIADGELKATVGDYIRLIQLERELVAKESKEVRLRWIPATDSSDER